MISPPSTLSHLRWDRVFCRSFARCWSNSKSTITLSIFTLRNKTVFSFCLLRMRHLSSISTNRQQVCHLTLTYYLEINWRNWWKEIFACLVTLSNLNKLRLAQIRAAGKNMANSAKEQNSFVSFLTSPALSRFETRLKEGLSDHHGHGWQLCQQQQWRRAAPRSIYIPIALKLRWRIRRSADFSASLNWWWRCLMLKAAAAAAILAS